MEWLLILLALPTVLELSLLTVGAFFQKRVGAVGFPLEGRWAVLIPAHNEEMHIGNLLDALKECEGQFTVFVVADNCSDTTGRIAQEKNAEVLTRTDINLRGKSYALQYGIEPILAQGFDWIVILDADAIPQKNFIRVLQAEAAKGHATIQAYYGIDPRAQQWRQKLMRIAFYAFNYLRPRGRWRLGFSAGLFGFGFALHKSVLEKVPYAPHVIVEDLWYHWELVNAGVKVAFCEDTSVYASTPSEGEGIRTQRMRWEGGRLRAVKELIPKTLKALAGGQGRFFEVFLELTTLPLSYFLLLLIVLAFFAPWVAGLFFLILLTHVIVAILLKGQPADFLTLAYAPFYMLWKLTTLTGIVKASKKDADWVRTDRSKD